MELDEYTVTVDNIVNIRMREDLFDENGTMVAFRYQYFTVDANEPNAVATLQGYLGSTISEFIRDNHWNAGQGNGQRN